MIGCIKNLRYWYLIDISLIECKYLVLYSEIDHCFLLMCVKFHLPPIAQCSRGFFLAIFFGNADYISQTHKFRLEPSKSTGPLGGSLRFTCDYFLNSFLNDSLMKSCMLRFFFAQRILSSFFNLGWTRTFMNSSPSLYSISAHS